MLNFIKNEKQNEHIFISHRLKQMTTSNMFVEPEEKSTGFKFKRVFDQKAGCAVSKSIQTTFQFVAPSKMCTALFSSAEFENAYIEYNTQMVRDYREGTYRCFSDGRTFKSNQFFQSNPLAIQMNLFTDDFEPCDPLKSRAGVHKITAFYFQIMNLPPKLLSKTDNIYLVALSDACDYKSDLCDVNTVLETILTDIRLIETNGILTSSKRNLKGTLACVSFDNLGGNNLFGFSGGFNANYYCRICENKRSECQMMVDESTMILRTKEEYAQMIAKIEAGENLSLTETKGIKSACILNDMPNFHILSNVTVDLMHDVFEGIVGFLLEEVFKYCVRENITSLYRLQSLVDNYYYGYLQKNKPSKLNIDKKNVGQNASQALCLILHLPFILFPFKEKLQPIWLSVESILQIIQILLSDEVDDAFDLKRLSEMITTHLKCYKDFFNRLLKPKHHFLLHHVMVIILMGPVKRFWSLRMEAKHQFFKRIIYRLKNFQNIKKTLAYEHQQHFCSSPGSLIDDVSYGKSSQFIECANFGEFVAYVREMQFADDVIEDAKTVKSFKYNDRHFKPGLLVANENHFYEIEHILCIQNEVLFLCDKIYEILLYDTFLNSFEIKSRHESTVLNFNDLKNNKPHEKKCLGESVYVIVDCLAVYKMHSK